MQGEGKSLDISKNSCVTIKWVCKTTNKITQEVQIMDINSLAHTKWECKYHIVFAPKYRRQVIFITMNCMQTTCRIATAQLEKYL